MSKVIRMNVLLTPQQKKRLEHISKTSGAPVAVVIRRAIDKEIGTSTTVKPGRPVEEARARKAARQAKARAAKKGARR